MGFLENVALDIFVSLIGAALLWVVTRLLQAWRNYCINKEFPVAGTYMTVYEDHDGEKEVKIKAIAKIFQKGKEISGETRALDSDRVWTLSGNLSSAGRIVGSYEAKDPHDNGLGSFFLEFEGDGYLEGIWAGFDSINKRAEAGRYTFRKVPSMNIDMLKKSNLDSALSVLGNALGELYIGREELSTYTIENNDFSRFGVVVYNDGILVGAATADLFVEGTDFLKTVPVDMQEQVSSLMQGIKFSKVLLIHSVAVDELYRQRGNATKMIRNLIATGVERGATFAVAVGWTDKDGCHIGGTLSALGFTQKAVLDKYWHEDSKAKNYMCPTCGHPCYCKATIYVNPSRCALEISSKDYI